jgi:hypothetical protein
MNINNEDNRWTTWTLAEVATSNLLVIISSMRLQPFGPSHAHAS